MTFSFPFDTKQHLSKATRVASSVPGTGPVIGIDAQSHLVRAAAGTPVPVPTPVPAPAASPGSSYPAAGTHLSYYCSGYDRRERVANGSGGYTTRLVEANSSQCGFVPAPAPVASYPPAGTYSTSYCSTAKHRYNVYHNGSGGLYDVLFELNSPSCGYVPPAPTPTPAPAPVASNPTPTPVPVPVPTPVPAPTYPPYGTFIDQTCNSFDLYDSFHDGAGGSYSVLVETNSVDCGYELCFAVGTVLRTPYGDKSVEDFVADDILTGFSEPTMVDASVPEWQSWTVDTSDNITVDSMTSVLATRRFAAQNSIRINGLHSTRTHVHFVYDGSVYGWKPANEVLLTDSLVDADLNLVPITSIEQVPGLAEFVYLNVEDLDTLQVKYNNTYILAHNDS